MSGLPPDFDPARVQTTRQAKRAWNKSGGVKRLSASQVRAIDRRESQKKKAAQQAAAEERRKENKRSREQKELKAREAKLQQVQEGKLNLEDTWGKVTASQPRLNAFFQRPRRSPQTSRLQQITSASKGLFDQITQINQAFRPSEGSETEDEQQLKKSLSQLSLRRKRKAEYVSADDALVSSGGEEQEGKENLDPSQSSCHTLGRYSNDELGSRSKKFRCDKVQKRTKTNPEVGDQDETLVAQEVVLKEDDSSTTLAAHSHGHLDAEAAMEDSLGDYLVYPAPRAMDTHADTAMGCEVAGRQSRSVQTVKPDPATTDSLADDGSRTNTIGTHVPVSSSAYVVPGIDACETGLDDETLAALYEPLSQVENLPDKQQEAHAECLAELDDELLDALYEPLTQDKASLCLPMMSMPIAATKATEVSSNKITIENSTRHEHGNSTKAQQGTNHSKDFSKSASFTMDGYDDNELLDALEAFEAQQRPPQKKGRTLPWNIHSTPTPFSTQQSRSNSQTTQDAETLQEHDVSLTRRW